MRLVSLSHWSCLGLLLRSLNLLWPTLNRVQAALGDRLLVLALSSGS